MRSLILICLIVVSPLLHAVDLRHMPIQDAGRVKPFDSFAREALQLVYGRKSYEGKEAVKVVLTWLLVPDYWKSQPFILIQHAGLKESLQLDKSRTRFSPEELLQNDRVSLYFKELATKRSAKEKLDSFLQAVQRLESQLTMFHAVRLGEAIRLVPPKDGTSETAWRSINALEGDLKSNFENVAKSFVQIAVSEMKLKEGQVAPEDIKKANEELNHNISVFTELARLENPKQYEHEDTIAAEVFLNEYHPFMIAWVLYLFAFLFLLAHLFGAPNWTYSSSWFFVILAFVAHTLGFGLRVYILGRPPVTNMYETVIWVPWGSVLFAMVFDRWLKSKIVLTAATMVATLCMIVADLAPSVLDASLQPLEPVLRDNFWLTTHVLMITISYGAFFLALMIGNIMLACYLISEEKYRVMISGGSLAIYRALNVGVVLLAAGIILGGIWADYSWGRFWGWDPKETWALIALLGYLALLHGRLVGLFREFEMAAGAIIAFSLVITAWYGVNFVLGAGLHSYGFGAGGVEYVAGFVGLHFLWVAYVALVRHNRKKVEAKT